MSQPRPRDLPGDRAHGRDHQARRRRVLPRGRRRDHARAARRPTTLERWPKGVHPGIVALHAREGRRRRVLPEARAARRAGLRRDRADRSSPRAATPTRSARPRSPSSAGPRRWARSPSTRGRCAATTSTIPTSCASTSTRSRAPTSPTPCASPREARALLDDLGYAGFPKTSGGRGVHIYVRIEPRWTFTDVRHAAIAFGRELERRLPGRGDDEVVEGGARRAHLRRLQPERPRPHDRLGLQRPAEAGRARVGAGHLGRAPRGRAGGLHRRDDAGALRRGRRPPRRRSTTSPTRCSRCSTSTSATRRGRGDMPYPPDYPKMPGEPKRVQPSRDRDRPARTRAPAAAACAAPGRARAPTAAARPGRCRRPAPRRGRRSPARGRSGPCPCAPGGRPTRPRTRSATGVAGEDEVDPHAAGPGGTCRRGSPSR